jgi:AcrR family transcriptional regulator
MTGDTQHPIDPASSTGTGTAVTRKGSKTRTLILRTAMTQFGEQGYRGASLRDIAARCRISHPGLLYHFPNKEALLLAVLAHRDAVDRAEHSIADDAGLDVFRRFVRSAAVNQGRRGIVELFVVVSAESTSVEHPAHQFFQLRYARIVDEVTQAYTVAQAAGETVDGLEPRVAAQQFIALMDGLQIQWLLDTTAVDMPAVLRSHIESTLTATL